MLGRVGAFLLLAALAVPYSPVPVAEPAEAGAFDELVRVYEYSGISKQERPLVLTQAETFDKYYFVMEADQFMDVDPEQNDELPFGVAHVQVKRFGTSDVLCEGAIFDIVNGNKHQLCEGLAPETHYLFTYTNTFAAEIQMWGVNETTPIGN